MPFLSTLLSLGSLDYQNTGARSSFSERNLKESSIRNLRTLRKERETETEREREEKEEEEKRGGGGEGKGEKQKEKKAYDSTFSTKISR